MGTEEVPTDNAGLPTSPEPAPEAHPLDLWFKRQRAAWWKKWRWAVVVVVVLLSIVVALEIASSTMMRLQIAKRLSASPQALAVDWRQVFNVLIPVRGYASYVSIVTALVSIVALGRAAMRVPQELEIALDPGELIRFQFRVIRRASYSWFTWLVIAPSLLSASVLLLPIFKRLLNMGMNPLESGLLFVFTINLIHIGTAEFLAWMLIRYPKLPLGFSLTLPLIPMGLAWGGGGFVSYLVTLDITNHELLMQIINLALIGYALSVALIFHLLTRRHVRRKAARLL